MKKFTIILTLFVIAVPLVLGTNGIDMSIAVGAVNVSTWQCIVGQNQTFAIIQAWDCDTLNPNLVSNIQAAYQAGMTSVDVYLFVSDNCDFVPDDAVTKVYNALQGVQFGGMFWFDIDQCAGCWGLEGENFNYIMASLIAAEGLGVTAGLYSTAYEWPLIMGETSWPLPSPLWYAEYDNEENFNDHEYDFGGFTSPTMKQYAATTMCGLSVNLDWYPDGTF
jgi:hypothetical protein